MSSLEVEMNQEDRALYGGSQISKGLGTIGTGLAFFAMFELCNGEGKTACCLFSVSLFLTWLGYLFAGGRSNAHLRDGRPDSR